MDTSISQLEWLTINEAATHLHMSVGFLRKRVRARAVPFVRVGQKSLRFRRRDLDSWMESNGSCGEVLTAKNDGR
jgi:excisionase family DNA binding protein